MLQEVLGKLASHRHLEAEEAQAALDEIMSGEATEAQIGALLMALRMKGETAEEITGFARAMRGQCVTVSPKAEGVVDTCGTGGDALDTFNISTPAAFVAAGAGVPIAKHGHRAVSRQCGSADVLRELGVGTPLPAGAHPGSHADGVGPCFSGCPPPPRRQCGGASRPADWRSAGNSRPARCRFHRRLPQWRQTPVRVPDP